MERGLEGRGCGGSLRVPSPSMRKAVAPHHHPVGLSGKGGRCRFRTSSMSQRKGPRQASTGAGEGMVPSTPGPKQGLSPRSVWAGNRKQGAGPPGTRGSSCLGPSGGEAGGGTDQGWAQGPLPTVVSVFPSVQGRPGIAFSSARTRTWARRVWVLGKEPHLLGRE